MEVSTLSAPVRRSRARTIGRSLFATLLDWRLPLVVGVYIALTLLATQIPFSYTFIVGKERGASSDLPFLQHFNTIEATVERGRWRWSRAQSGIELPGVGRRSLIVSMNIISHRANWQPAAPPTVLNVAMGPATTASFTLRTEAARYMFYVPAHTLDDGVLRLGLATEGWRNPNDRRDSLGVAVGEQLTAQSIRASDGPVLPSSEMLLLWSLGLALFWLTLRAIDFSPDMSLLLLLCLAVIIPALVPFTAPRLGFGNLWIVQAALVGLTAALLCAWSVPPLLQRLHMLPAAPVLRWLLLLMVLTFALKFGGRLYPASMPGDLQLHVNRFMMTVTGDVYIRAQHRGLPFPFPNGLYVMAAPFTLLGMSRHLLFELITGVLEATGVLLIYLLMARASGRQRLGLLAAAIYALTAGSHMVSWFAFATQVSAQWFTILLVAVLVFCWPQRRDGFTWWLVFLLLVQIFLAHIGQFMNLALVGVLLIPVLWWRARNDEERRGTWWLLGAGLAAGVFVGLFYYGAFWGLIREQIVGAATVGMNELTQRAPVSRADSLWALWHGGLMLHFGFFPVLFAIPGALLLGGGRLRGSILPPLIWLSFLVSGTQAIVPFLTLNSITTRWLMFSAWAIAAASAPGFLLLWKRGRVARLVSLAMAGYVCWITIDMWLNAMALRMPPIEPF